MVFSMWDETIYAERALGAGARAYVMKGQPLDVVIQAIRKVLAGQLYLSEAMTARLLGKAVGDRQDDCPVADSVVASLTDREVEVFRLIGQSFTVRAAAEQLELSPKTVESHCGNIKRKLGLRNSVELQQRAALWVHTPPL